MTDPQKYIDSGVAADITDIFDANNLRDVFNTDILNLAIKDDKVYGIPYNAYAMGIGYNIQMLKDAGFDEPPTTWDELRTMAKALTNRDNGVGRLLDDQRRRRRDRLALHRYRLHLRRDARQHHQQRRDGTYTAGFGKARWSKRCNCIKDLRWTDDVLPRDTLDWAEQRHGTGDRSRPRWS